MGNNSKSEGSCPRHGSKYLKVTDGAYYCTRQTPGEMCSICWYHPSSNESDPKPYLPTDPNPNYKPDVMKVIFGSWERRKYTTRRVELM